MLYSCTHMATVGVKGLTSSSSDGQITLPHWVLRSNTTGANHHYLARTQR